MSLLSSLNLNSKSLSHQLRCCILIFITRIALSLEHSFNSFDFYFSKIYPQLWLVLTNPMRRTSCQQEHHIPGFSSLFRSFILMELARNLNDRDAHCWHTTNVGKAANSDPVPCVHLCTMYILVHLYSLCIFVQYWFSYKAGTENLQSTSWWLPTPCISLAQPLQPPPPPLCTALYPLQYIHPSLNCNISSY